MNPLEEFDLDSNPLLDPPKKEKIEVSLSSEQQLLILKEWESRPENPPSIPELIRLIFPDLPEDLIDSRNVYGRSIKEFIISKFGAESTEILKPQKKEITLAPEQEEYIRNNCQNMNCFEMAKELFQNPKLYPASLEVKIIKEFVKTLPQYISEDDENLDIEYKPPKRIEHVLARIKKYVSSTREWDFNKLTPMQKKNCERLIHYLHDLSFKRQIDSYEKTEDKVTLESEMIKYCYNKPDLEQEEISQYISLCSYVVMEFNIKQNIEMLQSSIQTEYEQNNKVSGNLVDALESSRQELNSCSLRKKQLYDALTEKRSEKISKELKDKESLLNLFNTWKNYESRQQLLKIRQRDKENLRKEIKDIENMDELRQRVLGLSIDEIIDG